MAPPPVIRLHPEDSVVIARATLLPGAPVGDNVLATQRIPGRAQGRDPSHCDRANRSAATARSSVSLPPPSRPANTCTCTIARWAISPRTTPTASMPARPISSTRRHLPGHPPPRRQGRHAQLHRHPDQRELFGPCRRRRRRHVPPQPVHRRRSTGRFPNVDGVVALTHKTGCGMTQDEPLRLLRRTLAGYARHPNFSHVIVLGLGCEVNQIGGLMEEQRLAGRLKAMDIQTMGGSRKTVAAGVSFVKEFWPSQPGDARDRACVGTDGGAAMRRLRRLLRRIGQPGAGCRQRPAGAPRRHRDPVGNPGNLRRRTPADAPGGVAGSRRKTGRPDALVGGLHPAGRRRNERQSVPRQQGRRPDHDPGKIPGRDGQGRQHQPGRCRPLRRGSEGPRLRVHGHAGYDPVAATGQVAGGANLVCFTTGRGSVFGCKPAPSIKLATNTPMFKHIEDDMDVNCGTVLDGDETVQQAGQRIFDLILRVASGERDQKRAVRLRRGGVRAVGAWRNDVGSMHLRSAHH